MTSRAWALGIATALASVATLTGPALADEPDGSSCAGVWVSVASEAPRCASEFGTGREALHSAGFATVEKTPGFLCQIDEVPATCVVGAQQYWSYWQATRLPDGSWGPWQYSSVGYTESRPSAGAAEGWVLGNGSAPPGPLPRDPEPLASVAPVDHDPGSPVATVATAGVVALGGLALGGWYRRTRRAG